MPGGDRTGPWGQGPGTGRGAGYCTGNYVPGYLNPFFGRGFFGRGRRWRKWSPYLALIPAAVGWARGLRGWHAQAGYMGPASPNAQYPYGPGLTMQKEKEMLEEQAEILKRQLKGIQERLNSLENAGPRENE